MKSVTDYLQILALCSLIYAVPLLKQKAIGQQEIFIQVDRHALAANKSDAATLRSLVDYLAPDHYTEVEIVRSIYTWMVHNIAYDDRKVSREEYSYNHHAAEVLERKSAVCTGYATLFRELCRKAGIRATVVSGYSRGTPTAHANLEAPDHAWSAVQINNSWSLLDVTWAAGLIRNLDGWHSPKGDAYFLTAPDIFVRDHLPAQPMWQLMDCPWTVDRFKRRGSMSDQKQVTCISYIDSIEAFLDKPFRQQKLAESRAAYTFNPTEANRRDLGHSYLDYAAYLVDSSEQFVLAGNSKALMKLQKSVIHYCDQAEHLTDFYTWQREMFAHTLINYAATRFNQTEDLQQRPSGFFEELNSLLERAYVILKGTEATFFVRSAIEQYTAFKEIVDGYIDK